MIKKLKKIGDTTYSLVHDFEYNEHLLAQEIVTFLPKWKFLWITRYKKITESIDYMPIDLSTLSIMFNVLNLKAIEKTDDIIDDDLGISEEYETISDVQNKKLRDDFMNRLDTLDDADVEVLKIRTTHTPKNEIVKGYVKEGWHYFSTQNNNSMRRSHYVYKTGLYGGYLHINIIDEIGFDNSDVITTSVRTLIIPRDVMSDILEMYGNL